MAEFSKQYQDAFGFDHSDFDYAELFNDLKPNEGVGQICEGLAESDMSTQARVTSKNPSRDFSSRL